MKLKDLRSLFVHELKDLYTRRKTTYQGAAQNGEGGRRR